MLFLDLDRLALTTIVVGALVSVSTVQAQVSLGFLSDTGGHDLGGEVVLVSESVLEIRNFRYDGAGKKNIRRSGVVICFPRTESATMRVVVKRVSL